MTMSTSQHLARRVAASARLLGEHKTASASFQTLFSPQSGLRRFASASFRKDLSVLKTAPLVDLLRLARCYATAADTTSSEPTRTRSTTSKAKTAKKPAAKKKRKAKSAKPKKKKKKVVRAKKPKAKPTDLEKLRAKVKQLRIAALLDTPKLLPNSAFLVFMSQTVTKGQGSKLGDVAPQYKSLSADERSNLDRIATSNKASNISALQTWIASHTVAQIQDANKARRHLNRISRLPKPEGATRPVLSRQMSILKDPRSPKTGGGPYIAFSRERWASGDFVDVQFGEAAKSIGKEWVALDSAEKAKYSTNTAT